MKRLLSLILIICLFLTGSFLPVQSLTGTASTLSISYSFTSGTAADASQVNQNFTDVQTAVNNLQTDQAETASLTEAQTFTLVQTFTLAPVFNAGITFGSDATDGITNSFVVIDADNAGAEADSSVRFQRGSTDAADSRIEWDITADRFEFTTDGSTLADVYAGDGDATGEAVTYDQVVLDTGTQTVAGAKTFSDACTFSSALTLSTTCSTANHACPKTYIDAADSAITAGTCSGGASAPVGACTAGACYFDYTTTTAPVHYYCRGADSMTWVKVDSDSQDLTPWVSTSTDIDFTGAPAASTTDSLLGLGSDIASGDASGTYIGINAAMGYAGNLADWQINGSSVFKVDENGLATFLGGANAGSDLITNVLDPVSAQDAATKNYVDNSSSSIWGTGGDGAVTISMNTTLTTDVYYTNLTIDAGSTLTLNGYVVHVNGTLTWNGTIAAGTGGAGGAGGAPTAGTAGTNTRGSLPVINGVAGGTGGTSTTSCSVGTAGASVNVYESGANGVAGGASSCAGGVAGTGYLTSLEDGISGTTLPRAVQFGDSAGSGGGGGGEDSGTHGANFGGGGGGSGANGQTALIIAQTVTLGGSSAITGVGGAGGNGGAADASGDGMACVGGGGGSGGTGSIVILVYKTKSGSLATTTLTGGAAGSGGAGAGGGGSGTAGSAGNAGVVYEVDL